MSTPDKHYDFFYLDAHNVKELPRTVAEKIALNIKFVSDPQLMTQIIRADDKNVIKTGCAVQIGRDGSEYLSGSDDVLLAAISQFKCQARFIKPEPVAQVDADPTANVQE